MNDNGKLRVVLATHNAGKIRELADPMADFGIEVVGISLFPEIGEIEETGTTFEENALIKARAVCAAVLQAGVFGPARSYRRICAGPPCGRAYRGGKGSAQPGY